MCGILFQSSGNSPIDTARLKAALARLAHRGPDAGNVWLSPEKTVALGHTRLSITGVSNGKQPLVSMDDSLIAVVNGEFYDYQVLKDFFYSQSYSFRTESDSEIILPLYQHYGTNLFRFLNGEFAFVLYDRKNQSVLAARDRFGIKPLYYTQFNGQLLIASEIKALMELGAKPSWDESAVAALAYGLPDPSQSCFKHIKQIKPGHYISYHNGILTEKCYWDFKYDSLPDRKPAEYIEEFTNLLSNAIKRRLPTESPYCFYLSGGIDSSAIVALAQQYAPTLNTYTISFNHQHFDEAGFANLMADQYQAKHHVVRISEQQLADHYQAAIFHHESLCYQPNGVAKFLLSKQVNRDGYKVVLTGEGSDEILAGYPPFMQDFINTSSIADRQQSMHSLQAAYQKTTPGFIAKMAHYPELDFVKELLGYIPSQLKNAYDIANLFQQLSPANKTVLPASDAIRFLLATYPSLRAADTHIIHKSCYLFSKTIFPSFVLSYLGDRAEMAHSIEARLPFLDRELVEFCNKLPISLKIKDSREKFILYEALKEWVPPPIYARKKHPFSTPPTLASSHEKNSPLQILLNDIIHSQSFKDIPFFNQVKCIAFTESLAGKTEQERAHADLCVNLMISAYFLQNQFITSTEFNHHATASEVTL